MNTTSVIKQHGHRSSETYDTSKLATSIRAACLAVRLPAGVAEDTATHTTKTIEQWLQNKAEITSEDIRRMATNTLAVVSPEAGYFYKHHHTLI